METVTSPEHAFGLAMGLFVLASGICCLVTFGLVQPDLSQDPIITVYGKFNICISFDYSPAKEFMAVVWNLVTVLIALHIYLFRVRLQQHYPKGSVVIAAGDVCGALLVAGTASMSLCFLIGPARSVVGHTLPYQGFIVSVVVWMTYNILVIETWPPGLARGVVLWWRSFAAVFLVASACNIYMQWILMLEFHGIQEKGKHYVPAGLLREVPDLVWATQILFYRQWHPLSHHSISLAVSPVPALLGKAESTANICCYEVAVQGDMELGEAPLAPAVEEQAAPSSCFGHVNCSRKC